MHTPEPLRNAKILQSFADHSFTEWNYQHETMFTPHTHLKPNIIPRSYYLPISFTWYDQFFLAKPIDSWSNFLQEKESPSHFLRTISFHGLSMQNIANSSQSLLPSLSLLPP